MSEVSESSGKDSKGNVICENKTVEYILEINDVPISSIVGDSSTESVETRTNYLSKEVNLDSWKKCAIVKLTGPDESSIATCVSVLEQAFPIFLQRKELSRGKNVTIISNEKELPFHVSLSSKVAKSNPFANDQIGKEDTGIVTEDNKEVEGNSAVALNPAPPLYINRFTVFNSETENLNQNQVLMLLGSLSNFSQQPLDPGIPSFENVTVALSLDYVDIGANQGGFNQLLTTTNEPLLTMKVPIFEKFTGKDQFPGRPIPERSMLPQKTVKGLYDHEGKHGCGNSTDGSTDQSQRKSEKKSIRKSEKIDEEDDNDDEVSTSVNINITIDTVTKYVDEPDNAPMQKANKSSVALKGGSVLSNNNKPSMASNRLNVSISSSASDHNVDLQYTSEMEALDAPGNDHAISLVVSSTRADRMIPTLLEGRQNDVQIPLVVEKPVLNSNTKGGKSGSQEHYKISAAFRNSTGNS